MPPEDLRAILKEFHALVRNSRRVDHVLLESSRIAIDESRWLLMRVAQEHPDVRDAA